ncbi:putative F420-dependent oxidoreductase [Sinobacterium caligoides]|uniref:Putative F420-dependent oxidoreductase n=1 Tax=Sinobacterium caligoides TaxID=933926 RepID=A0A3N2DH30_9GAMM|nr:TIGR03617 family F420-dependent LLM class oxidoreductase [Sinobacterium caligoides]ROR99051.1 putative F420-dependent oxidoreductase [Sinobacterium caligoides]
MRVYGSLIDDLRAVPETIADLESCGYTGAFSAEINNDPFLPLLLAAEHSQTIELMTSIAVAFARNPMSVANIAHDLNQYSNGRFVLGLGSQIKPHITRRMSMPWSKPAARMREFIEAMRAIWACWYEGEPLNYNGEFYQHTLMTPMFTAEDKQQLGAPLVKLAGVGPLMTQVAGEVADGLIAHGFTTAEYLRQVTLPNVEKGLATRQRQRDGFDICCPVMVASGDTEQAFEQAVLRVRSQIAFYCSTPAYRGVLEVHDWGEMQPHFTRLSKQGDWVAMTEMIDDEMLNTFAVICERPDDIAAELQRRYGGLIDSWMCTYQGTNAQQQRAMIDALES